MATHAAWKGYLRLSLVTFPVRAYTAGNAPGGEIHLNQLHDKCKSRIRYKKTCPIHGEVTKDEIVMGYEFEKDQYVVVDPSEVDVLRSESDKNIRIDAFVPANSIEPVFYSGRSYYLAPDSAVGQRPYSLIRDNMVEQSLHGVAQTVIGSREQIVLLWPTDQVIAMSVLEYATHVKDPSGVRDQILEAKSTAQERELAGQLIEGMRQDEFDLTQYRDDYTEKLTKLIEAKVEGRELVTPARSEAPAVINLIDALRKSMKNVKPAKSSSRTGKASAKRAAPARKISRKTATKKVSRRKTG